MRFLISFLLMVMILVSCKKETALESPKITDDQNDTSEIEKNLIFGDTSLYSVKNLSGYPRTSSYVFDWGRNKSDSIRIDLDNHIDGKADITLIHFYEHNEAGRPNKENFRRAGGVFLRNGSQILGQITEVPNSNDTGFGIRPIELGDTLKTGAYGRNQFIFFDCFTPDSIPVPLSSIIGSNFCRYPRLSWTDGGLYPFLIKTKNSQNFYLIYIKFDTPTQMVVEKVEVIIPNS